jgi:hypothetical protein
LSDGEQPIKYKMEQYHKNPRKITDKELSELKKNIELLGDLSGIVHELNTDEIIAGNQRSKAININDCEIIITEKLHNPNLQGTVAWGHVIWKDQKLNYRQVRWDKKQIEQANITANSLGGDWDWDILKSSFEKIDLLNWGLDLNSKWNVFEGDKETKTKTTFKIEIKCNSKEEQEALFSKLNSDGLNCKMI